MKDKIEYISGYVWEQGKRSINEDSICIRYILMNHTPIILGIVCDGIAGLSDGDLASTYAVSTIENRIDETIFQWKKFFPCVSLKKQLNRIIYRIHIDLCEFGNKQRKKLGTTISMILIYKRRYYLFHIGDSRIYKFGKKDTGEKLTIDEIGKNAVLLHALGVGKWKLPYYKKGIIRKGESLLLCSDGFYRKNNKNIIEKGFACHLLQSDEKINHYLQTIARFLIEKDETDNISAILIKRIK